MCHYIPIRYNCTHNEWTLQDKDRCYKATANSPACPLRQPRPSLAFIPKHRAVSGMCEFCEEETEEGFMKEDGEEWLGYAKYLMKLKRGDTDV